MFVVTYTKPTSIRINRNKPSQILDTNNHSLSISDENQINILARAGIRIGNSESDIDLTLIQLLKSGSDGEESVEVGGFDIQNVIVAEEETEYFVEYQTAQELNPHGSGSDPIRFLLLWSFDDLICISITPNSLFWSPR